MPVSVQYELTGSGDSACTVEIDGRKVQTTASYLGDALGDLLRTVSDLLQGAGEASFSFDEEPGEYRWRFFNDGSGGIRIRIRWFDKLWGQEPDEDGKVVFDARCRLRTFAGAVASAAQAVLDKHGMEGYEKEWIEHCFPIGLLQEIQQMLQSSRPTRLA